MVAGLIREGSAHHTSHISYVFQKVGEKTVGCFSVELVATPPQLKGAKGQNLSKAERHKKLEGFTHRFRVIVRDEMKDQTPISGLIVRARFSTEGWEKTFPLQPLTENGDPAYAANVGLGPRGPYEVAVTLQGSRASSCEKIGPGETLTAKIAFDNDYESLREVMDALMKTMDLLGRETLTAGLDGEIVPPGKKARIRRLAVRFNKLVPWTVSLREGAAQNIYEDRAARMLELSEQMTAAANQADFDTLIRRIADVRGVCTNCHEIFQEADATGKLPKLPVAPETKVDTSRGR